jgi:hypothetical protein
MRSGVAAAGVIGFVVSAALTLLMLYLLGRSSAARDWPEASCEVTGARTERREDDWAPLVSWQYRVASVDYRVVDHDPRAFLVTLDQREAQALVARFPAGAKVPCYYDPKQPMTSVLDRSAPPTSAFVGLVVSGCMMIASAVVVIAVLARRRTK